MSLDEALKNIAAGNMSAFDALYEETKRTVYAIALSVVRERSLAEDVMQNCYLKVIRHAAKYRGGTNAAAWIAKIARNEALDVWRRRQREHSVDAAESEHLFGSYEIGEEPSVLGLAKRILKDGEFAVVLLVAEGHKRREIAHMLKIPIPTVTWRYNQAIKKLRQAME